MQDFTFEEEGHIYRQGDVSLPSVTHILQSEGFIDTSWFDEYSRTRGQYVHSACHLHDIGTLDEETLDPVIVPYLEGYKKFLADTGFSVTASEVPIYHKIYKYAGTPDKDGIFNGYRAIIDIKTGVVAPWTALQTAAYAETMSLPRLRFGLQLKPDGTYKLTQFKDRTDREVFLAALTCYQWKEKNK